MKYVYDHFFQLFNEAFYSQLRKSLAEPQLLTPEMASAWRSLFFDCTSKNILGLSLGSRPGQCIQPSFLQVVFNLDAFDHFFASCIQFLFVIFFSL